MPARLLSFTRSRSSFSTSTTGTAEVKSPQTLNREALINSANSCSSGSSSNASSISSRASSTFEQKVTTPTSIMDSHHIRLPHLGGSKKPDNKRTPSDKQSSPRLAPTSGQSSALAPSTSSSKSIQLDLSVESPPLVSFNSPANSSGALFSSQIKLDVKESQITISKLDLRLTCVVSVKRPVAEKCPECTTKVTELRKVRYAEEPLVLSKGEHRFPFSFLFPGHLPATTTAGIASLTYNLTVDAKASNGETVSLERPVVLKRAVLPGTDKHSVRIFPPTNLTAAVSLNPIIYAIGEFPVHLRLAGITTKTKDNINRWRVRKLNWRIEETQKMISPACAKHAAKVGGEGRGMQHEDIRIIGEAEVNPKQTPWKTDMDAGEVECEFQCAVNSSLKPVCDVEAPNGLSISHNLVVEMVVAEEWAPKLRPSQVTPTGAARILRMQFHLHLTQRAGLGISWDEEQPPMYEDVPDSPPDYAHSRAIDMAELEGQIDDLSLGDPRHPHQHRHSVNGGVSPLQHPFDDSASSVALRAPSPAYVSASPRLQAHVNAQILQAQSVSSPLARPRSSFSSAGQGPAALPSTAHLSPLIGPSRVASGPSTSGAPLHGRLTVDDFIIEPTYPRHDRDEAIEEEDDVEEVSLGTVA